MSMNEDMSMAEVLAILEKGGRLSHSRAAKSGNKDTLPPPPPPMPKKREVKAVTKTKKPNLPGKTGRPRGRPPKHPKEVQEVKKRGRGRPRKTPEEKARKPKQPLVQRNKKTEEEKKYEQSSSSEKESSESEGDEEEEEEDEEMESDQSSVQSLKKKQITKKDSKPETKKSSNLPSAKDTPPKPVVKKQEQTLQTPQKKQEVQDSKNLRTRSVQSSAQKPAITRSGQKVTEQMSAMETEQENTQKNQMESFMSFRHSEQRLCRVQLKQNQEWVEAEIKKVWPDRAIMNVKLRNEEKMHTVPLNQIQIYSGIYLWKYKADLLSQPIPSIKADQFVPLLKLCKVGPDEKIQEELYAVMLQSELKMLEKGNLPARQSFDLSKLDDKVLGQDKKEQFRQKLKEVRDRLTAYQNRIQNINITGENLQEMLFCMCRAEPLDALDKSRKIKKGIILKYHKMNDYFYLLLRLVEQKPQPSQQTTEKIEWISSKVYKTFANLSQGRVSLNFIQELSNLSENSKTLFIPGIKFTESLAMPQVILPDNFDSSLRRKASIQQENQQNPETLSKDSRCSKCKYYIKNLPYHKCSNCDKVYHNQCLDSKIILKNSSEKEWRCQDCYRCQNCFSMKDKKTLLNCDSCNSPYHMECLSPAFKSSIPQNITPEKLLQAREEGNEEPVGIFKCQNCVKCQGCETREAGKTKHNRWSRDFKFCSSCNKRWKQNQYCPICERFWNRNSQGRFDEVMIQCKCDFWVHQSCDRMLTADNFNRFGGNLTYYCPGCRKQKRIGFFKDLVNEVVKKDQSNTFIFPFWETEAPAYRENYFKVVKQPICLQNVQQRCQQYLEDVEQLKLDLFLIFDNAITFYNPKHHIHKKAKKLKEFTKELLEQYWSQVVRFSHQTKDEKVKKEYIMHKIDTLRKVMSKGLESQASQDQEAEQVREKYELEPEELMEEHYAFDVNHPGDGSSISTGAFQTIGNIPQLKPPEEDKDEEMQGDEDIEGASGIGVKNLRDRKNINYNEDRPLFNKKAQGQKTEKDKKPSLQSKTPRQAGQSKEKEDPSFKEQRNQDQYDQAMLSYENYESSHISQHKMIQKAAGDERLEAQLQYEEIDDQQCYYLNATKATFQDPRLIFEEMCYLCGSFSTDLLSCNFCGESFHTFCLGLPSNDVEKYQSSWKCYNCKFCEKCQLATNEDQLLYCDICEKAYHSYCLTPQIKNIPNCGWKCEECFQCQQCNTKQFFSDKEIKQRYNLTIEDYNFSYNFAYCYHCGLFLYKKNHCIICNQQNPEPKINEDETKALPMKQLKKSSPQQMRQCTVCKYWSHLKCSKLTPELLQEIENEQEFLQEQEPFAKGNRKERGYKCLKCLMEGKNWNFYVKQTSEQFLGINALTQRHELLFQLIQEILSGYFQGVAHPPKIQVFIKKFVEQNLEVFRREQIFQDWLDLLESDIKLSMEEQESQLTDENSQEKKKKPSTSKQTPSVKQKQVRLKPKSAALEIKRLEKISQELMESEKVLKSLGKKQKVEENNSTVAYSEKDIEIMIKEQRGELQKKRALLDKSELPQTLNINHSENFQRIYAMNQVSYFEPEPEFDDVKVSELLTRSLSYTQKDQAKISLKKQPDFKSLDIKAKMAKNYVPEPKTKAQYMQKELNKHKEGFLPEPRNLYKAFYYGNIDRHSQKHLYQDPRSLDIQKLNPNYEFDFPKAYIEIELVAVLKIKQMFHEWFQNTLKQIIQSEKKFMRKVDCRPVASIEGAEGEKQMMEIDNSQQQKGQSIEAEHDYQLKGPNDLLSCQLCRKKGDRKFSGRLIPMQVGQFIHAACALMTTDVQQSSDGQLLNFFQILPRAKIAKCAICMQTGASIFCQGKKCTMVYHFPCLIENREQTQEIFFTAQKELFCPLCSLGKEPGATGHLGLPKDFNTKKRLYLVKNQQMWSPPEEIKQVPIQRWQPFHYDCFNRIGNLTVLSLKRSVAAQVDEMERSRYAMQGIQTQRTEKLVQDSDYAVLRIYWKLEKGQRKSKSFYLFHKDKVVEIQKNDIAFLASFMGYKNDIRAREIPDQQVANKPKLEETVDRFWRQLMESFNSIFPRFNKENIAFSMEKFIGKSKYPIDLWNEADSRGRNFYLKHSQEVQKSITVQQQIQQVSSKKDLSNPQQTSKDDIFIQMLKINKDKVNQSSKHMHYDQMLGHMGKKGFAALQAANKLSNKQSNTSLDKEQQNPIKKKQKKLSVYDQIDTSREVELPIAMKYRAYREQPKRVEVGPSKIHRNGLYVLEDLVQGDIVIEYVGEKIRNKVADKREEIYEKSGIGDCYLFRLDKEFIIDATFFGNKARYLNHSCDATCSAKVISIHGEKHIILTANRPISAGEELTYNYNFDYESDKIECYCGAPNCLGRLN